MGEISLESDFLIFLGFSEKEPVLVFVLVWPFARSLINGFRFLTKPSLPIEKSGTTSTSLEMPSNAANR